MANTEAAHRLREAKIEEFDAMINQWRDQVSS